MFQSKVIWPIIAGFPFLYSLPDFCVIKVFVEFRYLELFFPAIIPWIIKVALYASSSPPATRQDFKN